MKEDQRDWTGGVRAWERMPDWICRTCGRVFKRDIVGQLKCSKCVGNAEYDDKSLLSALREMD